MPYSRDVRSALLESWDDGDLSDEEFFVLYDLNKSKIDYPYWKYDRFDLDTWDDTQCWYHFRFMKNDIYRLKEALHIPDTVLTYNRMKLDGEEALCMFLQRFAYPCRYVDMISNYGRSIPEFSIVTNMMVEYIYGTFSHVLSDFNHPIFDTSKLEEYCVAIHNKGAPLSNCFGFIDGTVRPICRPSKNQRQVYNGHKKVHSLKFQSIGLPNGLIGNLFGPIEGRRHDCFLLRESAVLTHLQQIAFNSNRDALCIYGDPAYPVRIHLQSPFQGPNLSALQQEFNTRMSKVRVSVEWLFEDLTSWFAFMDYKKNLKISLSCVGKMYLVCAILKNARTCLYGSLTSDYFNCEPPLLEEYLV